MCLLKQGGHVRECPNHRTQKSRWEIWKASNLKGCRHKRFPGAQIAEQRKKLCFYSRHTMLNRRVSSRGPCTQGERDYNSEEKIHQGQEIQPLRRPKGLWLAPFVWCLFKKTSQQCLQSFINHHGAKLSPTGLKTTILIGLLRRFFFKWPEFKQTKTYFSIQCHVLKQGTVDVLFLAHIPIFSTLAQGGHLPKNCC